MLMAYKAREKQEIALKDETVLILEKLLERARNGEIEGLVLMIGSAQSQHIALLGEYAAAPYSAIPALQAAVCLLSYRRKMSVN